MKKLFMPLLAVVLLSCTHSKAQQEGIVEANVNVNIDSEEITREVKRAVHKEFDKKESHREVISKEFEVGQKSNLRVYNIFGNVKMVARFGLITTRRYQTHIFPFKKMLHYFSNSPPN